MNNTLRGAGALIAWLMAPLALGYLAAMLRIPMVAIFNLILWNMWVFPHGSAVAFRGGQFEVAWAPFVAASIALVQWLLVAMLYGWVTRRQTLKVQILGAPVAIILTAIGVHLVLTGLDYTVQVDAP